MSDDLTLRFWGGPLDGQPVRPEIATMKPPRYYCRTPEGRFGFSEALEPTHAVLGQYLYSHRDPLRFIWQEAPCLT